MPDVIADIYSMGGACGGFVLVGVAIIVFVKCSKRRWVSLYQRTISLPSLGKCVCVCVGGGGGEI